MKSKSKFLKEKTSSTLPKQVSNKYIRNLFDRAIKQYVDNKLRNIRGENLMYELANEILDLFETVDN